MSYLKRFPAGEGWTYLIQGVDGGPVKIGRTLSDPAERFNSIQANSPVILRIVALLVGSNFEGHLHTEFADRRLHFEWFDPSVIGEIIASYPTDFAKRSNARQAIDEALAA